MKPLSIPLLQVFGWPALTGHLSTHGRHGLALAAALALSACSTQRLDQPAPVEDRVETRIPPRLPPGAENAGKPGYYTVRQGDTLFRIALDHGQTWRELQAWNSLSNPNLLEVGQVLRVVPPVGTVSAAAAAPEALSPATPVAVAAAPVVAVPMPVPAAPSTTAGPAAASGAATPVAPAVTTTPVPVPVAPVIAAATTAPSTPAVVARPLAPASPAAPPSTAAADNLSWVWPAQGAVLATFDEAKNKGIAIAGRMGDPVLAAADGRVVYAGAGLRGYGNLIILKHNNTYLTAYAHNQALLVREDQFVKQGQRIADMGSSDTDRVKLHFEVRRQGKPVDPLSHLPKR